MNLKLFKKIGSLKLLEFALASILLNFAGVVVLSQQGIYIEDQPPVDMTEFDLNNKTPGAIEGEDFQNIVIDETDLPSTDLSSEENDIVVENFLIQDVTSDQTAIDDIAKENTVNQITSVDTTVPVNNTFKGPSSGFDKQVINDSSIVILKVVVSENKISAGKKQWIEVFVQNKLKLKKSVHVRVTLSLPNSNKRLVGQKLVILPITAVTNVVFSYTIPKDSGGLYLVNTYVVEPRDSKKIISQVLGRPEFLVLGAPLRSIPKLIPNTILPNTNSKSEAGISQSGASLPALYISDLKFKSLHAAKNDVVKAVASIKNIGFTNIKDVLLNIYLVKDDRHFSPLGPPIYKEENVLLAPGENRVYNFNVVFPNEIELGYYRLLGFIEDSQALLKFNQQDNVGLSFNRVSIDQIVIDGPSNKEVLRVGSNMSFSWHSPSLKKFFVELSAFSEFDDSQKIIRIPKDGFLYSGDVKSTLNENEIIQMLGGDYNNDIPVYWRVVGIDDLGLYIYSAVQTFYCQP